MNKILMGVLIVLGVLIVVLGSLFIFTASTAKFEKPAIYLYPKEDSNISVKLNINGIITKTIPTYNDEWSVFVTKEGLINHQYDYLFYEADLNSLELPKMGWVVKYDNLDTWFDDNLPRLGLNEKETTQFKEYWLEKLPEANYYELKIFEKEFLKQNIGLLITPEPDTLIRLEFYFKPLEEKINIQEPTIKTPERIGFTVVEWGGMIDN